MSKVKALYHIVFCTKERRFTIPQAYMDEVHRFLTAVAKNSNCNVIRIGGIENHIHILINLHPTVALATLMRDLKSQSSAWMRTHRHFMGFGGWAEGYFACTVSPDRQNNIVEYIKNQYVHHHNRPLDEELMNMYRLADLPMDERDMR